MLQYAHMPKPTPQIVRVLPALESERTGTAPVRPRVPVTGATYPIRCQLWYDNTFIDAVPVMVDSEGNIGDVVWTPTELQRINKLAFVWGTQVFDHKLTETVIVRPGNPLRLALAHLRLKDRFGREVLKAGSVKVDEP